MPWGLPAGTGGVLAAVGARRGAVHLAHLESLQDGAGEPTPADARPAETG
jgi:hypothetical protein